MNLILCGLQACGKTTVGKKLADTLQWNFIDTDQWLEETEGTGLSSRQIALTKGEAYFRALEQKQIERLSSLTRTVVAVGGGSFAYAKNKNALKNSGVILYLKITPCTAWNRIIRNGIPSYVDQKNPKSSFHVIAEQRLPLYEQMADLIFDVESLNTEEIITLIVSKDLPHV
ncbi:MAG: shikimate kinase [Chlamydiota bacterium]